MQNKKKEGNNIKPDGKGGKSMHVGDSWTGRYYSLANFIGFLRKKIKYTQVQYYSRPSMS